MEKTLTVLLTLVIFSCQTRSVTRIAPDTQIDLSGRWNDSDSRSVADKMITELLASSKFKDYANEHGKKPAIVVGLIRNKTSEHIDANNYIKKLEVAIYNSNIAELVESDGEDFRINYANEITSYFTNPNITVYRGEDHEHLMLLYFKAINFLKMDRPEDALVECRRLNIRLNQLSDKYASAEKLQRSAFIHTLMGIIYQSAKDYNNAFIAYRNALEVYENEYAKMFGMNVPDQLKKDLLESAWRTGFQQEFDDYKIKFEMNDYWVVERDADLVFFWHNGLGPVKDEWSIGFIISSGPENTMVFSNPDLSLTFPYKVDDEKDRSDLSKLEMFRVAFPRYAERPLYFQSATLEYKGEEYSLELAEDINKVAFRSLQQRMLQEFAKGLLRAALKKAAEQSLRKKDDRIGAVLGLVNAMTEKADTRNWQTLPHGIYYSRLPLSEGKNEISLRLNAADEGRANYTFTYQVKKGQTLFHTFSSLETSAAPYRYY